MGEDPTVLYLVNPAGGIKGTPESLSGSAPPLGLLSIAFDVTGWVNKKFDVVDVRVRDASVMNLDSIIAEINKENPQWVGVTSTLWSYDQALRLIRSIKDTRAKIIVGGPHPAAVAKNILRNVPEIDYVGCGHGERTVSSLIELSKSPQYFHDYVPNLAFRNEGQIEITPGEIPEFALTQEGDVDLLKYVEKWLPNYHSNFIKGMPSSPFKRFATFISHRGCRHREVHGPCLNCCITDKHNVDANPWGTIKYLHMLKSKYHIDYAMDTGDDMQLYLLGRLVAAATLINGPREAELHNIIHLKEEELQPITLDIPKLSIYSRADSITDTLFSKYLQVLGVYSVFVGFESGSDEMLGALGKGTTKEQNLKAAKILSDHGIHLRAGFMLAIPGETESTMEQTVKMAEEIIGYGNIEGISCLLFNPIPGSRGFNMLTQRPEYAHLKTQDSFDPIMMEEVWAKTFCKVPLEKLRETQIYLRSLASPINQ